METTNFTLQWEDASLDSDRVSALAAALEQGWQVLITEQGWPQPTSTDQYLLRVTLDPGLSGSGYTTVYTSDDYPQGYPVIYLNPSYLEDEYEAYARSVAIHELAHTLQYVLIDWTELVVGAMWYWEATAEWLPEIAAPELDTYALSTYWYARYPNGDFDTFYNYHPYGMVFLNACLDEYYDADFLAIWQAGSPEGGWDTVIADAVGEDFATIITTCSAAYAAGELRESALYEPITPITPTDGRVLDLGLYGTWFYQTAAPLQVSGPAEVVYLDDAGQDTGGIAAITRIAEGDIVLGAPADTGADKPTPAGCGCNSSTPLGGAGLWLALLLLRRRAGG